MTVEIAGDRFGPHLGATGVEDSRASWQVVSEIWQDTRACWPGIVGVRYLPTRSVQVDGHVSSTDGISEA